MQTKPLDLDQFEIFPQSQEAHRALLTECRRLRAENEKLREALQSIAGWDMHSGAHKYKQGEHDPCGYYSNAYYLIEAEVGIARDKARAALGAA